MIICVCNNLSSKQIQAAISAGGKTYEEILDRCGCTPCCETCKPEVLDLIQTDTPV